METALQRIIRKTGRRPVECRCRLCRQQCRIPCLGTPEDILRLLKAGYRERLAPTRWAVGLLLGKIPYIVPMVQAKQEAGGCTFFQDGLCELHAAGLKPTEGRLSHHTITHGEPEVRNVALVERGQRMAGRAELRHDTGDCPDNGKIDEGRFHE